MDMFSIELPELRRDLEASQKDAYIRALALRNGDGWQLYHAWAVVGSEPPQWAEEIWRYEQHLFIACHQTAADLAALCPSSVNDAIVLGEFSLSVPTAIGPANCQRHPSYSRHDRGPLPVPVTDIRITAAERTGIGVPHEILAGEGPSFPEPNSAWRAFATGDYSLAGAQAPPTELATLRVAADAAWIGPVHVTASQLTAEVCGIDVAGAELELFSESIRDTLRISGPGTVAFPLPSGLPSSAWLWLKRGTSWLDYRSLDIRSGWTGDLYRAEVTIDVPVEPQANIEALIYSGEGPKVEFKEMLPTSARDRRTLKTVAAFASGGGGKIVFGVNRDELTITGLGAGDAKRMRDDLERLVHAAITPNPSISATDYTVDGRLILVLDVEPGLSAPYGLIPDSNSRDKPEYYVRRGASTYHMQPNELRESALSHGP
jgi:hypothetical protein